MDVIGHDYERIHEIVSEDASAGKTRFGCKLLCRRHVRNMGLPISWKCGRRLR